MLKNLLMKHKQTSLRWITLYFLLFIIMSACSSDHEVYDDEPKTVEPLTVNEAMDWYSRSASMLTKQKSTTDNPVDISYKPFVHLAELFTDDLWYAVESPLDFGDSSLMIMTPEVANYVDTQGDGIVKQVLKLVVLRNRETGETYSFIMAVVPELDYMLRKGDELEKIVYLNNKSDFSGYILFYTLNGEFVSGSLYKGGKTLGNANSSAREKINKKMVAMELAYTVCGDYSVECGAASGGGTDCITRYVTVYVEDGTDSSSGSNSNNNPPVSGGNNSDSKLPLTPLPLDDLEGSEKKPEKRTDCTENAQKQANAANTAMNYVIDNVNALRYIAQNDTDNEYATSIRVTKDDIYMGEIKKGTSNYVVTDFAQSTLYALHTHNDRDGLTGPSVGDIYTVLHANSTLYESYGDGNYNFYGGIIFAHDGSEYLISFEDRGKAHTFYKNQGSFFQPNLSLESIFQNSTMKSTFSNIMNTLSRDAYSEQNSYDYAMSYMLDSYATGVKISKKESGETEFKEMKTEHNIKTGYKPKICP